MVVISVSSRMSTPRLELRQSSHARLSDWLFLQTLNYYYIFMKGIAPEHVAPWFSSLGPSSADAV
jgi:hypothetical protein